MCSECAVLIEKQFNCFLSEEVKWKHSTYEHIAMHGRLVSIQQYDIKVNNHDIVFFVWVWNANHNLYKFNAISSLHFLILIDTFSKLVSTSTKTILWPLQFIVCIHTRWIWWIRISLSKRMKENKNGLLFETKECLDFGIFLVHFIHTASIFASWTDRRIIYSTGITTSPFCYAYNITIWLWLTFQTRYCISNI